MRSTRRPIVVFTLSALVVMVAVAAASTVAAVWSARAEAEHEARDAARVFASTVVSPMRVADLEHTSPVVTRELLDETVSELLSEGDVYRVKVWTIEDDRAARIVYSDLSEIEGMVVPVSPTLRQALTTNEPVVVPVPPDPAHRTEQRDDVDTVEVYMPYRDADDAIAVAELYLMTSVRARVSALLSHTLPIAIGGLVLLFGLTFPLALRLARSHATEQSHRRRLAEEALAASDAERRRLARIIHDGPVQHLSAVSMSLERHTRSAVLTRPGQESGDEHQVIEKIREQIAHLRGLLDDLNPADESGDLSQTLLAVADSMSGHAAQVEVTGPALDDIDASLHPLILRSGSELLRNALTHSAATHVTVHLSETRTHIQLHVRDDGVGFDPSHQPRGHHGLKLVRAAIENVDGTVTVSSGHVGTTVVVRIPRHQ